MWLRRWSNQFILLSCNYKKTGYKMVLRMQSLKTSAKWVTWGWEGFFTSLLNPSNKMGGPVLAGHMFLDQWIRYKNLMWWKVGKNPVGWSTSEKIISDFSSPNGHRIQQTDVCLPSPHCASMVISSWRASRKLRKKFDIVSLSVSVCPKGEPSDARGAC